MEAASVAWHGTDEEWQRLTAIVARHCACVRPRDVLPAVVCGAHQLLRDQRALDGLLFAQRLSDRIWHEEFDRITAGAASG